MRTTLTVYPLAAVGALRNFVRRTSGAIVVIVALLVAGTTALADPRAASALELDPIGNFADPVFVTSDPEDPDRLFIVKQSGSITLLDHGTRRPFLDISANVEPTGEQGLLSMAFDPGYATNGRLYVFYVGVAAGDLRVAEFTTNASGNAADPASRRFVIVIPHPSEPNHNGGQLQIGPDGYLYIGTGDGGGGGDPRENAQNLDSLLGKILRIDPDPTLGGAPYSVPSDNPFVGAPGADEIWSYGLRNPWRFSFDRLSGALVIGDVGQGNWEEIDYSPQPPAGTGGRGTDFGWDCREGAHPFEGAGCPLGGFTDPVFEYPHSNGRCSITGGYISRDPGLPDYAGRYLYADVCAGPIRSLIPGTGAPAGASDDRSEPISVSQPTSFGEDSCGRLYVTSLGGEVSRIQGATPTVCQNGSPDVVIVSGPRRRTTNNDPGFAFSAEAGATFECRLGGPRATNGEFAPCSSPRSYTNVADGRYTFQVRSNSATNVDPTPATRRFTVDTTAPQTRITRKPKGKIKTTKRKVRVKVAFASENHATFKCKQDEAAYKPCNSPYRARVRSKPGRGKKHKISIRAADRAGNVDRAATVKFKVIRKG